MEKADPLHLVGTKGSARRRKRGGMKEGGRKEGKDYWKIEGDKGVGFGGCHHRFSMLDAPCLLAIVKGRKLNHRKLQERTTEIVESSDRREFFSRREREEFRE